MNLLSENIKNIREALGLTQFRFGVMLEATKAMVQSYENGKARPKKAILEKLTLLTGISEDDLTNKDIGIKSITADKTLVEILINVYLIHQEKAELEESERELSKFDKDFEPGTESEETYRGLLNTLTGHRAFMEFSMEKVKGLFPLQLDELALDDLIYNRTFFGIVDDYKAAKQKAAETLKKFSDGFALEEGPGNISDKTYLEQRRDLKNTDNPEFEGITYVPITAQAGYGKKIVDPMFRTSLRKIFIPGMPYRGEAYRIFEVEGNSMEPTFKEHFYVIGEKVETEFWHNPKNYYAYVLVTEEDVWLKRVFKKSDKEWVLISDNQIYPQFLFPVSALKELWLIKRKIDWEMAPPRKFEITI